MEEAMESTELYPFTGVRRHYVLALRTQLPVPEEGWTVVWHPPECDPPELICGGVECPRAVVTRFFATSAPDTRTAESLTDVFEAASALAERPKVPRPAFGSAMALLRPVVTVAAPVTDNETPEQHFERCFGYVVDNARALILASEELCPPVSRQQLVPTYIVIDEDDAGTRRIEGAALMADIYLGPNRATRHHTARPSQLVGQVLSTRLGGDWTSRERDKLVGAWRHDVARLRNRVIHFGHRPSEGDAVASVDGLATLEKHVLDRLAARSNVYPRASLLLAGKEGLERRGRFGPARATYQHQSL